MVHTDYEQQVETSLGRLTIAVTGDALTMHLLDDSRVHRGGTVTNTFEEIAEIIFQLAVQEGN